MARYCTICLHPDRRAVEAGLIDRHTSYRTLAVRYRVTLASLFRHRMNHLAAELAENTEIQKMLDAEALQAKLLAIDADIQEVIQRAKTAPNDRMILLAVREIRAGVDSMAKLAGLGGDHAILERIAQLEAHNATLKDLAAHDSEKAYGDTYL